LKFKGRTSFAANRTSSTSFLRINTCPEVARSVYRGAFVRYRQIWRSICFTSVKWSPRSGCALKRLNALDHDSRARTLHSKLYRIYRIYSNFDGISSPEIPAARRERCYQRASTTCQPKS